MTLYDEINFLVEQLLTEWHSVFIVCDGDACKVSGQPRDTYQWIAYSAPTLIEALRLARQGGEV